MLGISVGLNVGLMQAGIQAVHGVIKAVTTVFLIELFKPSNLWIFCGGVTVLHDQKGISVDAAVCCCCGAEILPFK